MTAAVVVVVVVVGGGGGGSKVVGRKLKKYSNESAGESGGRV